jgi:hypothetical protein
MKVEVEVEVDKEFLDAFEFFVWGEFGYGDLEERCEFYREDEKDIDNLERADGLERAFAVLEKWYARVTNSKKTWREQEAEEYQRRLNEEEASRD